MGYKPAPAINFSLSYSCSYSSIVPVHERTGRDLSLRNYYHEKSDVTMASPTIATAATIELMSVFGLSAFDLLRCRRQSDAGG
ncbi:MAG TPA: hypothetical protein VIG72_04380 [Pontibacter sp.]